MNLVLFFVLCFFFGLLGLLVYSMCVVAARADAEMQAAFDSQDRITVEGKGAPLSDMVHRGAPPQTEFPEQHLSRLHPSVRAAMGKRAS